MDSPVHEEVLEDLAVTIARETAALALAVRERAVADPGGLDTKSSATDVVTEGDRACEALVRERLAAARPDDLVLGEEGGTSGTPAPGQVRWIVDPIDGTVNYTHGLPWFSVSLGAEVDGVVVAGAVVEPVSGRVWRAARGHGAFRDDAPLRVSALEDLRLGVVGTGLNYDPGPPRAPGGGARPDRDVDRGRAPHRVRLARPVRGGRGVARRLLRARPAAPGTSRPGR